MSLSESVLSSFLPPIRVLSWRRPRNVVSMVDGLSFWRPCPFGQTKTNCVCKSGRCCCIALLRCLHVRCRWRRMFLRPVYCTVSSGTVVPLLDLCLQQMTAPCSRTTLRSTSGCARVVSAKLPPLSSSYPDFQYHRGPARVESEGRRNQGNVVVNSAMHSTRASGCHRIHPRTFDIRTLPHARRGHRPTRCIAAECCE